MRIEIEKQWFEKNKARFAEQGDKDLHGEETKYYVIQTDEQQDIFGEDLINDAMVEGDALDYTISNTGLYINPTNCAIDSDMIETLVQNGDVETVIKVIGVITKKMNQIKSLLESAKAL